MFRFENFYSEEVPTDEDINKCIEYAKDHDCVVRLTWQGPGYKWYGDTYSRFIKQDSTFEEIKASMPTVYGL